MGTGLSSSEAPSAVSCTDQRRRIVQLAAIGMPSSSESRQTQVVPSG
jgi:hypothetical protein